MGSSGRVYIPCRVQATRYSTPLCCLHVVIACESHRDCNFLSLVAEVDTIMIWGVGEAFCDIHGLASLLHWNLHDTPGRKHEGVEGSIDLFTAWGESIFSREIRSVVSVFLPE